MESNKEDNLDTNVEMIIESLKKIGIEVEKSQTPVQKGFIKVENPSGKEILVKPEEVIDFLNYQNLGPYKLKNKQDSKNKYGEENISHVLKDINFYKERDLINLQRNIYNSIRPNKIKSRLGRPNKIKVRLGRPNKIKVQSSKEKK